MKLIISLFAVTLLGQIEPGQYPQNAGSGGSCSTLGGVLSGTCTTATFTAPNAANGPVVLDGSGNASFPGNVAISNTLLGIQIATPANPLAGTTYLYPKTGTNVWCSLSPTGVETCMGSGALPGTVVQTNQVNTYGAFLQDFSAGTVKLPALTGTQITTGLTTTGPDFEVGLTSDTVNRVAIGLNSTDIPRLSFGPGGSTARDLFLERAGPATQRWGAPDAAAPVAQTIGVQNVVTGTSNTAGALTTFIGSKSTGSAAGGGFAWQVSPAGGSGTAVNSLVTAMTLTPVGLTTIEPMTLPNEIALAASSATDSASLGPELTTSGTCSGTGWTGTYPNYVAPGTTAPLTCTGFTSGSFYQTVTVIGVGGSGSVTIAIGTAQTASGASGTVTAGLKANGTSLTYTPASSYTGTITISAKLITPISTFSYLGKDSTGASSFKALYQTLGSLNNSFQGGGGTYNTTGYNNSAQGYNALYFNTTGSSNLAQGYNALYFNTTLVSEHLKPHEFGQYSVFGVCFSNLEVSILFLRRCLGVCEDKCCGHHPSLRVPCETSVCVDKCGNHHPGLRVS